MWTSWHNRRLSCTNKAQRRARQFLSMTERDGRWEVGEKTDTFLNKCKFLTFYCCSNKARLWYYKKLLRFGFRHWNKRHPRGISRSGPNGSTYECLTHQSMSLLWSHNLKTTTTKKDSLDWNADILFAIVCIRSSLSDQIQNLTREDEVTPSWSTPPISPLLL